VSRVADDPGARASHATRTPGERAARLLRWYPRAWRDRYGEEFTELLIADIEERPRCAARTRDVARSGSTARLAEIGLAGSPLVTATAADEHHQVRASLGTLSAALAACLALAAAMWSQLMVAWGMSNGLAQAMRSGKPPSSSPVVRFEAAGSAASAVGRSATIVTSVTMLILLALAIAAALPVLATVARRLVTGGHRGLGLPAAVAVAAGIALFTGGRYFENGWVGTGGQGGFIPGGLAAFTWALTLWVTAYWAHMGALAAFPLEERTWMVISPLALAVAALAVALVIRRAGLSPRVLAFEARLATAACAVLAVLLAGCCCWVVANGSAAAVFFHAGRIDVAATSGLALALAIAAQARTMAMRGLRLARG
jgi:hypothetical protein